MSMPAAVGAAYPDPMFDLVPTTTPAMLTALAEALRGRTVAGITIHDAVAESVLGADDRPIVRLSLVLDDAAPDLDTWPYDALREIDRLARTTALELGVEEFVYIVREGVSAATGQRRPRAGR